MIYDIQEQLEAWAKCPTALVDRAYEIYRIAVSYKYSELPERMDAITSVGLHTPTSRVVIVGYSHEYFDNYDETGFQRYVQFEVTLEDFLHPDKFSQRLGKEYVQRKKEEAERLRMENDKEYREYVRLKAKFER